MFKFLFKFGMLVLLSSLLCCTSIFAQKVIAIRDTAKQHIFRYNEIYGFEDTSARLDLNRIKSSLCVNRFKASTSATPVTQNINSAYWYRINIHQDPNSRNNWILEFFDQTIDSITVYSPDRFGNYRSTELGSSSFFNKRFYHHKNLSLNINNNIAGTETYYVRIKSHQQVNIIIVLRSVSWFISYALDEYFFFGMFYGMILIFGLYNLIMFTAMRQRQYLYYIAYNLSIGLYEMCADGMAFQYIWPSSPEWNHYAYGIALFSASIFALLFTQSLLNVKQNAPKLNKSIWFVIACRSLFFVFCLFDKSLFSYKIIEFIPLTLAFFTGCYILKKGYRAARFFVIGYSFLLVGFIIKSLIALNIWWLPVTALNYYSLSFCFIMEMLFITFAIGDGLRILKKNESTAQLELIRQLKHNKELNELINKGLEEQVKERTKQLIDKTSVIEDQNEALIVFNRLLKEQAEEISRMNMLLEKDNLNLHQDIQKVTHNWIMSAEVDFDEFSKTYPDRETCFKFLADLKWNQGYACRRCINENFSNGHLPYSRRCSKCGYEESVIAYTILQNTRIPVNKAFYIVFLMYTSKGKISSHKLSEILSIRQSTCWAYSSRIKKVMEAKKKEINNAGHMGWSKLVIDPDSE
jgi:hypothetical protein